MTLIELLLALLIASLVVGLLYTLYHTASTSAQRQQERLDGFLPASEALNEIGRDLACAFGPRGNDECALILEPATGADTDGPHLSLCSMFLDRREGDITWTDVRRITYQWLDDGHGDTRLVRTEMPLAGPGCQDGPKTNMTVRGIKGFSVRVFDGESWVDAWPGEKTPPLPQAVRVELTLDPAAQPNLLTSDFFIPAGNIIKAPAKEAE